MTKPFWPDAAGLPSRVKAVEDVNGAAVGVIELPQAVGLVISGFVNMPLIVGEGLCQRPERKKKEQKQAII